MSEWHPVLAAVEGPTGIWRMVDPHGHEYGRVEIRRVMNGDQTDYGLNFTAQPMLLRVTMGTYR